MNFKNDFVAALLAGEDYQLDSGLGVHPIQHRDGVGGIAQHDRR